MKHLEGKEIYIIKVEAESESEATEKAYDLLEGNKHKYHDDSDGESSVRGIA